jgi:predicted nucleotidyltransferase
MRIDPKGTIAGQPALKIRELLKYGMNGFPWGTALVSKKLNVSDAEANRIIEDLYKQGYVESYNGHPGRQSWKNTTKGNALSLASAAKPVKRTTAEKILNEFITRVQRVNEEPYYLYKVAKVAVFGSYLTDREYINDIDLAVDLQSKFVSQVEREKKEQERILEAEQSGRAFHNFLDMLIWPQREVLLFLKSRSRTISLHEINEPVLQHTKTDVIYTAE